ncbi:MAG TPA: phosphotransferase [Kofleriaceae bacterium]|nr:phosphotransferase [Kofleriaceae bacterium]
MNLHDCLPPELRTRATTITRVGAGLSGAGVFRVEAGGKLYVLKLAGDAQPVEAWRCRLEIQRRAAAAGVAPRVVHIEEAHRAVTSAFVSDHGFAPRLHDPATRASAIELLGTTLRRVHDLALPAAAERSDPRALLATLWAALASLPLPDFVRDAVERALATTPPPCDRPLVLSHNDVNPTNLAFDGEQLVLLDWDTTGANEPFYDLAAIAVFLRLDTASCLALLAAHDGVPVTSLPERFVYDRQLVAVLCGAAFLHLARLAGHAGSTAETLDTALALDEVYPRMRAGALRIDTPDGKWAFGLALVKRGDALFREHV